jgi:predicted MFS family arabinose efflux permease
VSGSARLWQNLWVRLAVALAFADASIVVLALPQIVDRLHTSIGHSTWVIMAYNLALIVTSLAILPVADRLPWRPVLVGGLALFAAASLGCGAASRLSALVPLRCAQGVGGALVLCASLPLFWDVARPGDSPLYGWSAAAAIGAAVGPAAGGVLTQLFDWRSIFLAQAPVAVLAAVAVLVAGKQAARADAVTASGTVSDEAAPGPRSDLGPLTANIALMVLSAALIGALFLVVVELINAWLLKPIAAAAIVSTIPVTTALAERAVRGRSPVLLAGAGAVLLAAGLALLALASYRALGLVILALALCGSGLGLAYPGLTTAALESSGPIAARAAKTVAARDAGILLGLLLLTPVFVSDVNTAPARATPPVASALFASGIPLSMDLQLGAALSSTVESAPQSSPPDVAPAFARVAANASPADRARLAVLQLRVESIIQDTVTRTFRRALEYAAILALLVLPLLAAAAVYARRARSPGTVPASG